MKDLQDRLAALPAEAAKAEKALAVAAAAQYKAEHAYEVVRARTEIDIRQDPLKYGFPKTTDALVEALIPTQQVVIDARTALVNAKIATSDARANVASLDTEKRCIEKLVDLMLSPISNGK